MNNRQRHALAIIKVVRRFLVSSPANQWRITNRVKSKIFRLAYPHDEVETEYLGAKLLVPTKDTSLVPALVGNYYERLELEIFQSLAAESRTIIDVGGNIGLYAIVGSLAQTKPKSRLFSFEPVAENVRYLRHNALLNKLDEKQIHIIAAALGDTEGDLIIHLSEGNIGTHSASSKTAKAIGHSQKVKQMTLDGFVKEKSLKDIDILKIDVEGFDGQVLRGATALLRNQHPTLFVEYIPRLLKNCNFDPAEYIKLITSHYKHCFAVNEINEQLYALDISSLKHMKTEGTNLIFTDKPAHLKLIRQWL